MILSRKEIETIVINNNIFISVVEIMNNKVRLEIHAPNEIPVTCGEIWVLGENRESRQEILKANQDKCVKAKNTSFRTRGH